MVDIPEKAVEAAAKTMWEVIRKKSSPYAATWEQLSDFQRQKLREELRDAALKKTASLGEDARPTSPRIGMHDVMTTACKSRAPVNVLIK